MAARLTAVAREFDARRRAAMGCRDVPSDPELDQFMVMKTISNPKHSKLVSDPTRLSSLISRVCFSVSRRHTMICW